MSRPKWSFLMGSFAAFIAAGYFLANGILFARAAPIALGVVFLLVALVWLHQAWRLR